MRDVKSPHRAWLIKEKLLDVRKSPRKPRTIKSSKQQRRFI